MNYPIGIQTFEVIRKHCFAYVNKTGLLPRREEGLLLPPEPEDGIDRTTTWLEWCDEYIRYSAGCGNGESAMRHKLTVRKRVEEYLDRIDRTNILLKDVTTAVVSGLYDYMRNDYRNPSQIKVRDERLAGYSLLHFGQTVNAIFTMAPREGRSHSTRCGD